MSINIFIPGQPQGKGRARSRIVKSKTGKQFTSHYTPAKTRSYENHIRACAIDAVGVNHKPTDQPVKLTLSMTYQIPLSWPLWKRMAALNGEVMPTVKPDADNVEKAVKDGLNKIAWIDDCQVVACYKTKLYGEQAGIRATIEIIKALPAQIGRKPAPCMEKV